MSQASRAPIRHEVELTVAQHVIAPDLSFNRASGLEEGASTHPTYQELTTSTDHGITPFFASPTVRLYKGEAEAVLASLRDDSIDCIVTSPPYYGQRDYGVTQQLG